jgi:hypothetical protein
MIGMNLLTLYQYFGEIELRKFDLEEIEIVLECSSEAISKRLT